VALYAPEAKYLNARCTSHYQRLSGMFEPIASDHFRQVTRYLQNQIEALGQRIATELALKRPPRNIEEVLAQVLPPDDSAIQFSTAGGGFTSDLDKSLHELYIRYVERYATRAERARRDEEDIWKVFRAPLEKREVIKYLTPKKLSRRTMIMNSSARGKTKCGMRTSRSRLISLRAILSKTRRTAG